MDTFCLNQNEMILIDESKHIVYMKAKKNDRVNVRIYVTSLKSDLVFWCAHCTDIQFPHC